jgi:ribosomal protein L31
MLSASSTKTLRDYDIAPFSHSFYRDGTDMNVFCFAEREHAQRFRERFGGEFIDPKSRPKWPGSPR